MLTGSLPGNREAGVLTPLTEHHMEECLNFVWTRMLILALLPQRKELSQDEGAATAATHLDPTSTYTACIISQFKNSFNFTGRAWHAAQWQTLVRHTMDGKARHPKGPGVSVYIF